MSATLLSAQTLITDALTSLGVYGVGQTLQASDATLGLRRLNAMLSTWAIQDLTIPSVSREVFSITANQGTYTIGPGANFNTIRPPNGIQFAALLMNASTPTVEVPINLLTNQGYQAISMKSLTSSMFTNLFYNPTFTTSGYGTITLWPIPTTALNSLVLYLQTPLVEFTDLTTQHQVPSGYEEAISMNLAVRLAAPYARPLPDEVRALAIQSRAILKRANTPQADLGNDFSALGTGRYGYNIVSGNM